MLHVFSPVICVLVKIFVFPCPLQMCVFAKVSRAQLRAARTLGRSLESLSKLHQKTSEQGSQIATTNIHNKQTNLRLHSYSYIEGHFLLQIYLYLTFSQESSETNLLK